MGIRLKPALIAAALAALALGAPAAVVRAAPAQTYYIPMPEEQVFAALSAIFPGAGPGACDVGRRRQVEDPIITYVSIAAAVDGTVVVYDHWEDGYEPDIEHPVQPTTGTWGDADGSNGIPPGFAADRFGVDRVIVLHNPVRVGTRAAVLDYNAGDKLAASIPVAVTRAAPSRSRGSGGPGRSHKT